MAGQLVAGDKIHHLAAGSSQCDLGRRYSDDARMSDAASSVLTRLFWARSKFNGLAYQQTIWQEQNESNLNSRATNVDPGDLIIIIVAVAVVILIIVAVR